MHKHRGKWHVRWLAWMVSAAVFQVVPAALAQSDSASQSSQPAAQEYQQLVDRGVAAYAAQRPAEARKLFAQAHIIQPGARTLRALGIADLALDNYTLAKDELEASLREQVLPLSDTQRDEVHGLLNWMQSNLGKVHLSISPLDADTQIDGQFVKAPEVLLAPEAHKLTISAHGFVPQERTITVSVSRPMKLEISLERAPASVADLQSKPALAEEQALSAAALPSPLPLSAAGHDRPKLWPWLGGAGAVLLVTGGALFAFGMHDKATVEHAQSPVRLSELQAAHDRVPWLTGVGLSLGIAGLAGMGAATVLLLTEREPREDLAWSMDVGPLQLSMKGRF